MKRIYLTAFVLLVLASNVVADDFVMILLDTSGSTGEYMRTARKSRLDVAKTALVDVLSKIPDTTKVGMLTFNGWVCDLQPVNRAELANQVQSMRSGGNTPLYTNMAKAATRLLQEREKQGNIGSYKLLVITDGEATDDPTLHGIDVLKDILSRNVTVDVIGLEMKGDHSLKTQINGSYMKGDDPDSITQAVSKSVAEVGSGTTRDASNEAFADIKDLPEPFILGVLKGITTFANQPIGELPLIKVVQSDGTVTMQPASPQVAAPESPSHMWIWIVAVIVLIVCIVGVIVANLDN